MKTVFNLVIMAILLGPAGAVRAQSKKGDKQAARIAAVKRDVEGNRYTFVADYALPMRGAAKPLTETYYDLRVTPDSVISFLPYYGRAYFDVPYNPTDYGIKFTSTDFTYKVTARKKGRLGDLNQAKGHP